MKAPYFLSLLVLMLVAACAKQQYQAEPLEPDNIALEILSRDIQQPAFRQFMQEHGYVDGVLQAWDFNSLLLSAFYFNPDIRLAQAQLELRQAEELTAAQRANPVLGIPLEHHSDTAGGKSPWLIGLLFDFVYERKGKRQARTERAKALTEAARIKLEETAWNLRSELRSAFINYFAVVKRQGFLQAEFDALNQAVNLLQRREELGQASNFEVSKTRLELQQLKLQMMKQKVLLDDALYTLLGLAGLPVATFARTNISFSDIDISAVPGKVSVLHLQDIALHERFDVRRSLFEYTAAEQALKLEIEKQYPDISLSPGFIFDQDDKIWALSGAWILPLFHNNEGPISEALARRKIKQVKFIQMQTKIINDIAKYQNRHLKLMDSLRESNSIMEQMQSRTMQIKKQFELGYTDQLVLIRSNLETLKFEQALFNIKLEAFLTLQKLEDILQHPVESEPDIHQTMEELFSSRDTVTPD